jgi:hypothetical protein
MANAIVDIIEMGNPLGGDELPDTLVILSVFLCGRGNHVVEDDHNFLRTSDFLDAEFLEFFDYGSRIVMR